MTRTQFQESVQNWIDSTGVDAVVGSTTSTPRWGTTVINSVGGLVHAQEWTGILNQNRTYRFASVAVTTDVNGAIALASLTTGSGDTTQTFHRLLSGFTDGNYLWRETDYDRVPLGTIQNYQSPWDYVYYLAGSTFQLLPVMAALPLTTYINWTPVTIDALASDSSVIDFPAPYEQILAIQTAGNLLNKGGNEASAANVLFAQADDWRKQMYSYIGRLTTRPSSLSFSDLAVNWMGG